MKKLLFYSFALIIALATSVLLLELAARLLFEDRIYSDDPLSEFEHDPLLGWKGIVNYQGLSRLSKSQISINSLGFRDPDWNQMLEKATKAGTQKMLFLGDSITYGYEIEQYERFTEQLQNLCKTRDKNVITFNAGIPGFGTDQEFRSFEILSPIINPHVVLLRYTSNDIGDAALPYFWGETRYRLYRPFHDVAGNLILNETVPRRFSLKVKGTVFGHFRLKIAVDRIESLIDDIGYSRRGISENRRIELDNRTADDAGWTRRNWDMGCVGSHPAFRDIYDKNKMRNFNLIKKLADLCRQKGATFMILTDFDGHSDPSHPHQELISFLEKNSIRHVNVSKNGPDSRWGSVNFDGHPNFLANYYVAANTYEALTGESVAIDFSAMEWFGKLSSEIDFSKGEFHKHLFGGEWGRIETFQGKMGRWLKGGSRFLLKGSLVARTYEIRVLGMNSDQTNALELVQKDGPRLELGQLDRGQFEVKGRFESPDSCGLLLFELVPHSPLFIQSIVVRESSPPSERTVTNERRSGL